ncbi:hypothetical protein D3C73_1429780 [compost metagenome]
MVAIGAVHHLELLVAQVQADQVGDVGVVLDHQNAFGLVHRGWILLRGATIVRVFPRGSYHELFNST